MVISFVYDWSVLCSVVFLLSEQGIPGFWRIPARISGGLKSIVCGIGTGVQRDIVSLFFYLYIDILNSCSFQYVTEYMTKGICNSLFKKYKTHQIAEEVFEQAKKQGLVEYLIW